MKDLILSVLEDIQVKLVSDSSNKVKVAYKTIKAKGFGEAGNHSDDIFVDLPLAVTGI